MSAGMAATNKCLAKSNKSGAGGSATNRQRTQPMRQDVCGAWHGNHADIGEAKMEGLLALVPFLLVFFVPSIIAGGRRHRSKGAIIVLNIVALVSLAITALFGAVSFVLLVPGVLGMWLIALVWSFTGNVVPRAVPQAAPSRDPRWAKLRG